MDLAQIAQARIVGQHQFAAGGSGRQLFDVQFAAGSERRNISGCRTDDCALQGQCVRGVDGVQCQRHGADPFARYHFTVSTDLDAQKILLVSKIQISRQRRDRTQIGGNAAVDDRNFLRLRPDPYSGISVGRIWIDSCPVGCIDRKADIVVAVRNFFVVFVDDIGGKIDRPGRRRAGGLGRRKTQGRKKSYGRDRRYPQPPY